MRDWPFTLFPDPDPPRTLDERRRRIDQNNARDLDQAARSGVLPWVQILTQGDARVCPTCRALEGRVFPINEVVQHPLLPCAGCTGVVQQHEGWCRCTYLFFDEHPDAHAPKLEE